MELIHILPKGNLVSKPKQKYELYLADEILKDPEFYETYVRGTPGYKILDNSLNELGTSVSLDKLEEAASIIEPDEFVMPDDINPDRSDELFWLCRERITRYRRLAELKKMVVVHAYSVPGAMLKSVTYAEAGANVLAYSKVTGEEWGSRANRYDGRVSVVANLVSSEIKNVEFHFLGFAGLNEFDGFEWVSEWVRSMDSRLFLETRDLWSHRDSILSHVSLGSEREIPDIEAQIEETRRKYESYGLR